MMTSRERLSAALSHEEPDRVPIDMGTPVSSIHREAYSRLLARLGFPEGETQIIDGMQQVVAVAEPVSLGRALGGGEPGWWIGSVYLVATFVLSIALPMWLDPPSLMRRPLAPRLTMIMASALVLTLAWQGLPMLIPVVGLGLYQGVARRMSRQPVTATFAAEFLCALVVAASLGWGVL